MAYLPICAKRTIADNQGYFQFRCYNMEQTRGSRRRLRTRQSIRRESMGRKRTHKRPLTRAEMGERGAPMWQQSQALNSQAYSMAYSQMLNIALSRFKWLNLPKTCDAWFLEYNLLYFGYATIAFPHSKPGVFFSTQAVTTSNFNVYYKPKNGIVTVSTVGVFRLTILTVCSSTRTVRVRHSFRRLSFSRMK